mmetsp:Transcript_31680/g.92923  ORF Transcript_31680/g.92923 Transcript_31680/m.92923 type:complete len:534 (+) Transcript_31680:34-1635(+)
MRMTGHGFDSNARKTSSPLAFVVFFKSLFGAGLLALPNVLGRVGLILGAVIYLSVALGCSFSCYLLLRAREITSELIEGNATRPPASATSRLFGGDHNSRHLKLNERQTKSSDKRHHLVTYGDLADALLGNAMATATRWTIIILNVLFTAGLVIIICENLGSFVPDNSNIADDENHNIMSGRHKVGLLLLPLVSVLVQIPWLQDMWIISMLGLAVYTGGVIGSSFFSAFWTILFGDVSGRNLPTDLWELKWDGVPAFMGNAVYALEGINLALPTVHAMQNPSDATRVVCGSVVLYGVVTLMFASIAYAGGLGGGDGTGLSAEECDVSTKCITPLMLQSLIQITLSLAMLLSIPVMLYPSTEMLEVMLTDRLEKKAESHAKWRQANNANSGVELHEFARRESETELLVGKQGVSNSSVVGYTSIDSVIFATDEEQEFSQDRSWKLRLFLSSLTVMLGTVMRSFTHFSGFVGAVGLSFAGFVLPPLLFLRAHEAANLPLRWPMLVGMAFLVIFGIFNMAAGGVASIRGIVEQMGQ